jgi:hypothetical protein
MAQLKKYKEKKNTAFNNNKYKSNLYYKANIRIYIRTKKNKRKI